VRTRDEICRECREAIFLDAVGPLPAEQRLDLEKHLADCVACRAYSIELRAATGGLRHLGALPLKPSPGFRQRWTRAVERANQPARLVRLMAGLLDWSRLMWLRNRRILSALAPLWVLILVFGLTSPDVGRPARITPARSPLEIARALKAMDNTLTASAGWYRNAPPRRAPATTPHRSRRSNQPVVFREEPEGDLQSTFLS
jgi:Putative zinc-finger